MKKRGYLLAIEGLEGAGKSTAIATIEQVLTGYNLNYCKTREPGGTALGEELRAILKNPDYKNTMDARTELLLMVASRIQLVEEVIKPALAKGIWVIADRFELSTFAYQGGGRNLNQEFIGALSGFALQGFAPDLTLYLRINPQQGLKRAASRGAPDRIEKEPLDFFNRVHQAYESGIAGLKNGIIIDAGRPLDEVQKAIIDALEKFIKGSTNEMGTSSNSH